MNRNLIAMLIAQLTLALIDGELTESEIQGFLKTVARAFGLTSSEFHQVFIEQDGDVHFILKKNAIDKIVTSLEIMVNN